jgi:glutathione S-transferase
MRKVEGGLRTLSTWVEKSKGDYLVQNRLTYADIAVCSVLGFMNVRWPQHNWASPQYYNRTLISMHCADEIAVNLTPGIPNVMS